MWPLRSLTEYTAIWDTQVIFHRLRALRSQDLLHDTTFGPTGLVRWVCTLRLRGSFLSGTTPAEPYLTLIFRALVQRFVVVVKPALCI